MHSNPTINQTIYSNIVYYDPTISMLEYNGSALIWNKYINSNISDVYLENLFAVQLAVNDNCLFLNDSDLSNNFCLHDLNESKYEYEYGGTINQRIYLNPITKTRPDHHQLIPSILLTFVVNK